MSEENSTYSSPKQYLPWNIYIYIRADLVVSDLIALMLCGLSHLSIFALLHLFLGTYILLSTSQNTLKSSLSFPYNGLKCFTPEQSKQII
jgi:hypothetical protein